MIFHGHDILKKLRNKKDSETELNLSYSLVKGQGQYTKDYDIALAILI